MPDDTLINLTYQVDRHEAELKRDAKDIAKLQHKVSDLTFLVENLYVLVYAVHRTTEEQESPFKEIPKLLRQIQGPGPEP